MQYTAELTTLTPRPDTDAQDRYRLLADNATDVVLQTGESGAIEWASPSVTEILGWQPHQIVGKRVSDLMHPEDLARVRVLQQQILEQGGSEGRTEARFATATGEWRWMSDHGRALFNDDGALIGGIDALRDIQAEHDARDALVESEEQFRTAMDFAPIGMAVVGLDRRFQQVNSALCEMVQRDSTWLIGRSVDAVIHEDDVAKDRALRTEMLRSGKRSIIRETRLTRADGAVMWAQHATGVIRTSSGQPKAFVSQFVDMTEMHRVHEQLQFVADHDPLTGLFNRRAVMRTMTSVLSHPPRRDELIALLYCDLDDLKPVNDSLGHRAGDAFIVQTASRIASTVRSGDTVGRVGGDEFVALLTGLGSLADAEAVATKMRTALSTPFQLGKTSLPIRVSMGLTLAHPGEDPDEVLHRADQALYEAKSRGGDRLVVFDPFAPGVPSASTQVDVASETGHN